MGTAIKTKLSRGHHTAKMNNPDVRDEMHYCDILGPECTLKIRVAFCKLVCAFCERDTLSEMCDWDACALRDLLFLPSPSAE